MRGARQQPADSQTLINLLMTFADEALKVKGSFNPISATMNRQGETALNTEYAMREELRARDVAATLTAGILERLRRGEVRTAAIAAMVLYGKSDSDERSTAVQVHVEQEDGYCADVFMPYRIRGGMLRRPRDTVRVRFSQPVAQESVRVFFP